MQALIRIGYNEFYLATTGQSAPIFGEESLVEVISIHSDGAVIDNGLVYGFIPFEYLELKGVYSEIISKARQTDQSE